MEDPELTTYAGDVTGDWRIPPWSKGWSAWATHTAPLVVMEERAQPQSSGDSTPINPDAFLPHPAEEKARRSSAAATAPANMEASLAVIKDTIHRTCPRVYDAATFAAARAAVRQMGGAAALKAELEGLVSCMRLEHTTVDVVL